MRAYSTSDATLTGTRPGTESGERRTITGKKVHKVEGIDREGYHVDHGIRLNDRSPDGAPAYPQITRAGVWVMILASMGVIGLLALIVLMAWGAAAAGVVFVFGAGLACVGNPVIWAAMLRSDEREHEEADAEQTA